jgi:hypothetical protein
VADSRARRPYAATANVLAVINRARSRNLPDSVGNDFLRIAGVPDAVFGRVTEALRFLGLVSEDQAPTELLRNLGAAPEDQYRQLLAGALQEAYHADFEAIDPVQDSQGQVIDQFRRYEPRSQTSRMVMLFLGLAREAGIPVRDAPRERPMRTRRTTGSSRPTRSTALTAPRARGRGQESAPASTGLFGLTEADVAKLDDAEFADVWTALGKIARARLRPAIQDDEDTADTEPPMGEDE